MRDRPRALMAIGLAVAAFAGLGAVRPQAPTDLDRFMSEVLARRDENWKKLQQYLLDERARIQLVGPTGVPLWGDERTFTWFIRDGFFVRSPLTANGVGIAEADRRKAEDDDLRRSRARERGGLPEIPPPRAFESGPPAASGDTPAGLGGLLSQSRAPQFVDNAYFLRFKFEAGTYAFAGRETLGGSEVLRIEYYPRRLFSHEQDSQDRRRAEGRRDAGEDVEAARERMMNKASLVTLWVIPASRQIVKYTFDNVALDFLPASWLLRVTNLQAGMTMTEAFAGVWLPHEIYLRLGVLLALGPIDLRYHVEYGNYREARGSGRLMPLSAP
ncbi:MAG: hypothetical protein IT184_17605 [Acidobacteria bacterium]|nr:hypothetical protein [Acidobacteriota bacterium]